MATAKKKPAAEPARPASVLDAEGQGAEEDGSPRKPGGQPGPRGPYRKKPKSTPVEVPPEIIEALGQAPFLIAGAVASFAGQRCVFDQAAVENAGKAFKAWSETWEEVELTPGSAYVVSVVLAFSTIRLEPIPPAEKPPAKPKEPAKNAAPAPAAADPDAPGSRAQPAA